VCNLKELLPLLYLQDHFQKEIIVVDDHSTDNTKEFLKREKIFHPELKVVNLNHPAISGKKKALQKGIQLARHEIILLTDADCRPNSYQWMQAMCSQFENDKVQIVLGYAPYFKQKGLLNAFIQYETLYTAILYLSAAILAFPYMGVGRNLAYRKSLFIHNNSFSKHASILGGDDDLFINLHANGQNTRVALGVHAQVKSIPQTAWKKFLNQKHRHLEAGKYYKFSDKIWLGTAVLSHLFFWICFCLLLLNSFKSPYIILSGFLIRTICLIIVYKYVSRRLNDQINVGSLVFLDFLFVIYYVITGIRAFFFKKKRWK
jgi:cellulose synthase/poly-beta-1,6-N-acetylglucosamine synthase-like glycosyltransferase